MTQPCLAFAAQVSTSSWGYLWQAVRRSWFHWIIRLRRGARASPEAVIALTHITGLISDDRHHPRDPGLKPDRGGGGEDRQLHSCQARGFSTRDSQSDATLSGRWVASSNAGLNADQVRLRRDRARSSAPSLTFLTASARPRPAFPDRLAAGRTGVDVGVKFAGRALIGAARAAGD